METIASVSRVSAADLAAWRRQSPTVRSAAASLPYDEPDPLEPSEEQARLKPRETYDAMLAQAWGGPEGQQASVRWLRQAIPHAVAHMTDAELIDRVDELIRDSVTRQARRRNMWTPVTIGGR